VWFGFIPEVTFLWCSFGYMCFTILVKWNTDWPAAFLETVDLGIAGDTAVHFRRAPSLLEGQTNFFLAPGTVAADAFVYGGADFQNGVQFFLLFCCLIAVPMLLIPIPVIEYMHHKNSTSYGELDESPVGDADDADAEKQEETPFDMSEVLIKQIIHTIEFVLGCVSNTASYLRLWALSLAHAQLSEVFWNFAMIMPIQMDTGHGAFVFVGFAVWFAASLMVLCGMESLSAFLHALRLHWVEFQNKFYYGDGTQFVPYSIREYDELAKPSVGEE